MRPVKPYAIIGIFLLGTGALALGQSWEISVGPAARFGQKIEITGSSNTQTGGVNAAATYQNDPASVGSATATANRTYAEGYVNLDPGTNNPDAVGGPGLTWNWGYTSSSQLDTGANRLSFTQTGGDRLVRDITLDADLDASDKQAAYGVRIGALRVLDSGAGNQIAIQIGLTFLSGSAGSSTYSTYGEFYTRTSYTVTDRYDTSAIVVPSAPYSGTFDGPGPILSNTPATRERSPGTTTSTFSAANAITFDVDTRSVELAVGPRLTFATVDWADFFVVPAVVVGYQKVDVERLERFTTSTGTTVLDTRARTSTSDLSLAFSIDAGAKFAIADGWTLSVLGGYILATDDVIVRSGPNEIAVSPSGFQASLSADFAF